MPFLVRGKARSRLNRPKPPAIIPPVTSEQLVHIIPIESVPEEVKIAYQEVTYRVPKEERLLDLPLEDEVEEEYSGSYETDIFETKSSDDLSIGVVLKKKRRK